MGVKLKLRCLEDDSTRHKNVFLIEYKALNEMVNSLKNA